MSQEEILQANPYLLTQGLHYNEVILVPAKITAQENTDTYVQEKL